MKDNVTPLPGMPDPPEQPELSPKARECIDYLKARELSPDELGEVIGIMLIAQVGGGLMGALKDLGLEF